jgi:hypothetical protein
MFWLGYVVPSQIDTMSVHSKGLAGWVVLDSSYDLDS